MKIWIEANTFTKIWIEANTLTTDLARQFLAWLDTCPLAEVEMDIKIVKLIKRPKEVRK